ncbi:hypothetical protein AB9K32_13365 [Allomuricauda sp. XS_ASV26]|uniref:hypothetical protein n=1 Tax=Allomuricauda sp. XS_ASV26 TaxID=3241292 RepID=UPI00351392F2
MSRTTYIFSLLFAFAFTAYANPNIKAAEDGLVTKNVVHPYVQELKEQGQTVQNIEVKGAGHAFFDWKPDAQTRKTFERYGVPYAAKMKSFFDSVFYK